VALHRALQPPGARKEFVWWVALPAMFGIFGALVLAMIGLQDLARRNPPHRLTSTPLRPDPNLAYRWGRTIFGGAAALAGICCVLSMVLTLASGLPVLVGISLGLALALGLTLFIALIAGILYLLVVGPRVAYFTIARYFGRGGPALPDQEAQAKVNAASGATAMRRPELASDQVQAQPASPSSTDIAEN
jgi:hypothetical protein